MENAVPQRIREVLTKKRWTTNQLSKELGISQPTVSRQLAGSVALSSDLICGVLNVFKEVSAEWLIRGEGAMEKGPVSDPELQEVCVDQAKEIVRLKQRIAELEGEKKDRA